jgi:hypothetical protein
MQRWFSGAAVLAAFASILGGADVSTAFAQTVQAPVEIPASRPLTDSVGLQPDGSLSTFRIGKQNYWLLPLWDRVQGGIVHAKTQGSLARPFKRLAWVKRSGDLFRSHDPRVDGNLWIMNTYQAPDGLLAFVHVENAGASGAAGQPGRGRIGLAWSTDNAETFTYLGPVIVPEGDPDSHNIQGIPYIVRNGYFMVYYHDTAGLAVARAKVADVLRAARRSQRSAWLKFSGSAFDSSGLGGPASRISPEGISHADAACSTYTGKCYLVLSMMNWGGQDTWIKLYESHDGTTWAFVKYIAWAPGSSAKTGYQYLTLVDASGTDNSSTGRRLFLYSFEDYQFDTRKMIFWRVELDR